MQHPDVRRLFDARWYASRYCPGMDEEGAWQHFSSMGTENGFDPNPLFDSRWYLETHPDARASGVLSHFLERDAADATDPSLLFESRWYLENNSDVRDAQLNPLVHYVNWGRHEGRQPNSWCMQRVVGAVLDFRLSARFEPDDLIGYVPGCSTLQRLFSGAEAATFVPPIKGYWVIARLVGPDAIKSPEWVGAAGVIGGRAEVLRDGRAYDPSFDGLSGDQYRAFCVRYEASPVIRNAISALTLNGAEAIRLAADLPAGEDVPPRSAAGALSMLVDADVRDGVVSNRDRMGAMAIIGLESGTLCRVSGLLQVPNDGHARPDQNGQGGLWKKALRAFGGR